MRDAAGGLRLRRVGEELAAALKTATGAGHGADAVLPLRRAERAGVCRVRVSDADELAPAAAGGGQSGGDDGGDNPRFIVTNLPAQSFAGDTDRGRFTLTRRYEELACARGEMENVLKQQGLDLPADELSTHFLASNPRRLWPAGFADQLLDRLRTLGCHETELTRATGEDGAPPDGPRASGLSWGGAGAGDGGDGRRRGASGGNS